MNTALDTLQNEFTLLQQQLQAEDFAQAAQQAHSLKNAYSILNQTALLTHLHTIETDYEHWFRSREALDELERLHQNCLHEIRQTLAMLPANESARQPV
ncbi:MAG: Hpt domain-containing protein [Thiolinea sp.]